MISHLLIFSIRSSTVFGWSLVCALYIYLLFLSSFVIYQFFYHRFVIFFFSKSTVKPVLSGHSKIHKTKIVMINSGLMEFERTAECNTFDLH